MKHKTFITIVILFFLASCQIYSVKIVHHEAPDMQIDFAPFNNIGCESNERGWLDCKDGSTLQKLGCNKIWDNPMAGGFAPDYPIASCIYSFPTNDEQIQSNVSEDDCIYRSVGFITSCHRFVIFKDGAYLLIKNMAELRSFFAPVESPKEALSFTLASDDFSAKYGQSKKYGYIYYVQELEDTYVETIADGYLVHVFYTPVYGCAHETESVEIKVTHDGDVQEINRFPVYRDPSEDDQCAD